MANQSQSNYVSALNEYCQKNKLKCVFEKQQEFGMAHSKTFRMGLKIHGTDPKICLNFTGEGKSLKEAKNDASRLAFEGGNILEKLKDKVISSNPNYASSSSADAQINDLTRELDYMTLSSDQKDKIYDAWIFAKKHKLSINFEFLRARRGISNTTIEVKLQLGSNSNKGKGSNDLEAIYNSVKDLDFDKLSKTQLRNEDDDEDSSDGEGAHKVSVLHELHVELNKNLEFTCILSSGPPQDPVYIHKCLLGDLITYGLGRNKKASKNNSASKMLKKLDTDVELESVVTTMTNMSRLSDDRAKEEIQKLLKSSENAVSVLENIDKLRIRSLKFTEQGQQIGVQSHFTTECKLLLAPDLKIRPEDLNRNSIRKNDGVYLRTNSRSTKKKTSKMEAAEKMLNLLKGLGAYTNEEVETNKQLKDFQEKTFSQTKDKIDKNDITDEYYNVLVGIIDHAADFLKDKPKYDPEHDFLAEIQEIEFENKNHVQISIRLSNEIYEKFSSVDYFDPYVSCIIHFKCGINISALTKTLDEMESKNEAAFIILQKLSKISKSSLY